jgi:hypothetical protein
MLACLKEGDADRDRILVGIPACVHCYRSLAETLAHSAASMLAGPAGQEIAIQAVERVIADIQDAKRNGPPLE